MKRALQDYRVLLLDQRGTGLSSPVLSQTLRHLPSAEAQASYLKFFRADSIVRDAESIRRLLLGDGQPWSVLGQSYGGFCAVHYLSTAPQGLREVLITGGLPPLERSADEVYRATYRQVQEKNRLYYQRYPEDILLSFDTNPVYAILHEAIYCQEAASRWSASRVRGEFPEFEISPGQPVYFTGEMIYPWMFAEYSQLRPLQEAAGILAEEEHWPRLYDAAALRANQVPGVATVYYNDMYVERAFSEETAQHIAGIRLWITNEYEHNGLRDHGEIILDRMLKMLRGG